MTFHSLYPHSLRDPAIPLRSLKPSLSRLLTAIYPPLLLPRDYNMLLKLVLCNPHTSLLGLVHAKSFLGRIDARDRSKGCDRLRKKS